MDKIRHTISKILYFITPRAIVLFILLTLYMFVDSSHQKSQICHFYFWDDVLNMFITFLHVLLILLVNKL